MNKFKTRLLNVARALREAPKPQRFDMGDWGHFCGTPSCALGHYAVRRDLQRTFGLSFFKGMLKVGDGVPPNVWPDICDHFGITDDESTDLFAGDGCDDAQNAIEAAEFIEAFAEKKWPTEPDPAYKVFREKLATRTSACGEK